MAVSNDQFLRVCKLLVSNGNGQGLDLSELHIKFSVKRSGVMTPNVAEIRVYNLNLKTADIITKEFTNVVLQAGYEGNYGVIFSGNIKQCIIGRESPVDTFVDIIAGDGDLAYNFAIINQTVGGNGAGSTTSDHLNAAFTSMGEKGVTKGYVGALPSTKLPRGKVLYGNARDYINATAQTSGFDWSIQDGKIMFVKRTTYLPGEAVVMSSKSGMIGTPQQTVEGINFKCLLNPLLKIHGRVQVDNALIQKFKLDQFNPGSAANTPVPLTADGVYYIYIAEHEGDTRGNAWYTNLVTLAVDPSSNPLNSVSVN